MRRADPRLIAALLLAAPLVFAGDTGDSSRGVVAIKAGSIHVVEEGRVIEGGGVLIVRNGKIQAVGQGLDIPPDAQVVDYGPNAVVIPGLIAAMSPYASGIPSPRTASPGLRAIDAFDPYGTYGSALSSGVTSAYIAPAESRLVAGQGAVVKLAGDDFGARILNARAAIHGAIDQSARNTPGYWEPPIPSTVDVGMDFQRPQLPKSTSGAIVALTEILGATKTGDRQGEYGPFLAGELSALLEAGVPWRIAASEPTEIRALLEFGRANDIPLIVDKALGAKEVADEIAAAGAGVVFRVPYLPNAAAVDHGKAPDARWPVFDVPAALVRAGARVAITSRAPRDLLFSAALATRGGLDEKAALRSITLTPAELLGVADRVGSLRPGKDADFCVLLGEPLSGQASVVATWIGGKTAWSPSMLEPSKASTEKSGRDSATSKPSMTVVEVEELHLGDGRVLRPGQVLMRAGKIAEVGDRVAHPAGAVMVRGSAAMPGIIDAFGHLGLEGTRKVPATDFELSSIVGPGDAVDRRVAASGITTVVLTPRSASKGGAPVMAYKPAAVHLEGQVIADPAALRLKWGADNPLKSGEAVRDLLAKAKAYRDKWEKYEKDIAAWTPPPPKAEEKDEKEDSAKDSEEEQKEEDGKAESEGDDKKKKKKKKKKDEEEELEPDPVTGVWHAPIGAGEEAPKLKLRLHFERAEGSGEVVGNLRCDPISETLIELEGYWDREARKLNVSGLGSSGWVAVQAEPKELKLVGTATLGEETWDFEADRISKEYVVVRRAERGSEEKAKKEKAPKGKPKKPKRDSKLEPFVAAMEGHAAVVVDVDRADEIVKCVAAFEAVGLKPVLYGAGGAHKVADQLRGRVAGILLAPEIVSYDADRGLNYRTPYGDLQVAGIPVAFHSDAEEGAVDLPLAASYAVSHGMSPTGALRALTSDAATMMAIGDRVGTLAVGYDADLILLDGPPLEPGTSVLRVWVNGMEVKSP